MPSLYVVATPIGNLNDLTPRMREALEQADLIAAEDTRVAMKLLNHLGLRKNLVSCHRHNEQRRAGGLIERMLREDLTVALTCDAGTPGISDPGGLLVNQAIAAGIPVTPVCGPCAAVAALSASGFDTREFTFFGFLPREKKALGDKLKSVAQTGVRTAVFYESPHRAVDLVEMIGKCLPGARVCAACDISKRYELILVDEAARVLEKMRANPNVEKGEYVVAVELPPPPEEKQAPAARPEDEAAKALLEEAFETGSLEAAAQRLLARGTPRNRVYAARLAVRRFLENLQPEDGD